MCWRNNTGTLPDVDTFEKHEGPDEGASERASEQTYERTESVSNNSSMIFDLAILHFTHMFLCPPPSGAHTADWSLVGTISSRVQCLSVSAADGTAPFNGQTSGSSDGVSHGCATVF